MIGQNDVAVFMEACGQLVENNPTTKNVDQVKLYMNLIKEEYEELLEAQEMEDNIERLTEVADACGDLIWVILGLCNSMGIPMYAVWSEISASNFSKTVGGGIRRREDGKILKPETYFPPNIKQIIQKRSID